MKTTILIIAASLFSGIVLAQEATVKAKQSASLQVAPQAKTSGEIKHVTKTTIKPAEANVKTNVKAATSSSIKAGNAIHSSVKAAPVRAAANVRTNVKVGLR